MIIYVCVFGFWTSANYQNTSCKHTPKFLTPNSQLKSF